MLGFDTMRTPKFKKLDVFNKIKGGWLFVIKNWEYKNSVFSLATMSCKNFGQYKGNVQKFWTKLRKCPKNLDKIRKLSKKFGQNKGNVQKFWTK